MTATQLETLVQQIVDRSTATTIGRHVDRLAEGIIDDILKARRVEFTALVDAAIQRALANLSAPAARDPRP